MKTAKTIVKNSIWLILGEVVSKISVFLLIIIVARTLGVVNFGKYNLALSFVMIFSVIGDLGLNIFLFREIARNKKLLSKYISNIFLMRVLLSMLFFAVVFIFARLFHYSSDEVKLIYLFALWICLTNLIYVFRTGFKAVEAMRWDAVVNILENVFRLAITIIAIKLGLSIFGVGIGYLMGALLAFCFSVVIFTSFFTKLEFNIDFSLWKIALKEMRFLALVAILVPLFGKFDALIISYFSGDKAVGLYSAALKLVWMLIFIPGFITQAAFPKLSQYAFQDEKKFSSLIAYLVKSNFVLTIVTSFAIFLFSKEIIFLIYGNEYFDSIRVLRILIWCFPLFGINSAFIYGLNARNKQKINTFFIGLTIFLNILLAIGLAPKLSYIGVSFATLASLLVLSVMFIVYYFKNEFIHLRELKFGYKDISTIKKLFLRKA